MREVLREMQVGGRRVIGEDTAGMMEFGSEENMMVEGRALFAHPGGEGRSV